MKQLKFPLILSLILVLMSCTNGKPSESESNVEPIEGFEKYGQEFQGKIAESYADSEQWSPRKNVPKRVLLTSLFFF